MKFLKFIFTDTKDIKRSSYIWNMVSSLIYAGQSALALMIITRTNGLDEAGVFSIAYAVASLLYFIGEYGARKYQVSDVNEDLPFVAYHTHRVITCTIMLAASIIYSVYGWLVLSYDFSKAYIILVICVLKAIEAYQEVYSARFQQMGRLDIGAKTNLFRTVVSMAAGMVVLVITRNMMIATTVWTVVALIAFLGSSVLCAPDYCKIEFRWNKEQFMKITLDCLPLFAGCFFLLYVGNAPKYAIDACMSDTDQAYYNFIFMPVFAVGLFANFVFNPILVDLAKKWDERELTGFVRMVRRQIGIIAAITMLAIGVALTFGCPVLGLMYSADLMPFKRELVILMIGGGMLDLVNFFNVVITVTRNQKYLMIGFITGAILAALLSNRAVSGWGITGASVLYVVLMSVMAAAFGVILIIIIRREKAQNRA